MSDDKGQQEPSMEDILASIRRILSEDEQDDKDQPKAAEPAPAPSPAPAPVAKAAAPPPPSPQPPPPAPAPKAAPPPPPPPPKLEPEPEPQPEPEPEPFLMAEPDPEPEPEEEDEDVLELTEEMVLDEVGEPEFDIASFRKQLDDDSFDMPSPHLADPEPAPRFAPRREMPDEDSLLAAPVREASTSALTELARAVARERGVGIGNGRITLEDLVRDMLRPILKEWLDQNLPYMIERMVKREIEKMVNRAEKL